MQLRVGLAKIGIGVSVFITSAVFAMPSTDSMTICYGVGANDKQSFKTPCIVTNTGGGGSLVTIYQIKGKDYTVVSEDGGEWLNDKPFKAYTRGAFFERLPSDNDDFNYFCYQSKAAHFCVKQ